MALGFGPTAMEAGQHALISLLEDFDGTQAEYVRAWKAGTRGSENGIPREDREAAVSHQCRGAAHARIQARGRRDHRQPVDPVGLFQAGRRSGRLSPGLAARSRGDRRRLHRDGRARASQARVAIPAGDARSRTAIGRRTCGSTARRTGTACRWTKRPSRFCWSISPLARA